MTRVLVGIHAYEDAGRLRSTIESVRENTTRRVDLVLLPDGPDEATRAALAAWRDIPQCAVAEARGAPAAFNRLAAIPDRDVIVLMEAGCKVACGWLEPLVTALENPSYGLAGPTTNWCWNEQGAYPASGDSAGAIADTARDAAIRYGRAVRTLEPLHSLADFCYAVRRDVIEAVGPADEGYGLGPCWEMDYNVRAARAGFLGVWVCAAYVHRAPATMRRRVEEARLFETSKHRYQDKFCGARLRGLKSDYRHHCRGDACANFAPPSLIGVRELRAGAAPPAVAARTALAPSSPSAITRANPLVTCIMPTSNRRAFCRQAVRCFLRQDYGPLELVVVDDGVAPISDCLPEDSRIRYVRLDQRATVGAKRNVAVSQARGEIIVHWDDDDWYPSWRVSAQVRALMNGGADICGTSRLLYYEPTTDRAWEYRYGPGRNDWVAGNTLAYRKTLWQRTRFAEVQVGEDALFVWNRGQSGLSDLPEQRLCVGTIHAANVSPKDIAGMYWHARTSADVSALMGDDIHFYRTIVPEAVSATWPLVSCIMPTYNRRALLPLAARLFLEQDYPNRELIVVDDGERPAGDLLPQAPNVRYFHFDTRCTIGAKRNFACEQARGSIIAHWDDDDWYGPERLRYQVAPLLAGQADVTGLENAFVLESLEGRFWTTRRELHRQMFFGDVHGGTLVFRRQLFDEGIRYPEVSLAEDAWFLHAALARGKRLLRLSNAGVFVYMRHGRNAWKDCVPGSFLNPSAWQRVERPPIFSAGMLATYRTAIAAVSLEGRQA
jgi:glycosyltransferase involved in cell wall biosynthesis